jgi:hypothetical protein
LQVKTEHRQDARYFLAVGNQHGFEVLWKRGERNQASMVSRLASEFGFPEGLPGPAAYARHPDGARAARGFTLGDGSRRQFQDWLEKAMPGLSNLKLRGVHADRDAARPRSVIVSCQGRLAALIELARLRQGQRMRGDGEPLAKLLLDPA